MTEATTATHQARAAATRWEIEQELANIWRELFDLPAVRRNHDFFALGGDSLMATILVGEIERAFGVKVPTSALVQNPTLAQLSAYIHTDVAAGEEGILVPVRMQGRRPPLFLVHGLLGHVVFAHVLGRFIGKDQPLYALRARGFDLGESPHGDVPAMARDYLDLVRWMQPRGPYRLGGYCSGTFVALEMGRQLLAQGEDVAFTVGIDPLEPATSFVQWRLGRPDLTPADPEFHGNVRQRLESEVYGRRGRGRDRLDRAVEVGVALDTAFARHRPRPYPRPLTIIASGERAPKLHDPAQPWRQIAASGLTLCIASRWHLELFFQQGPRVAKLLRAGLAGEDLRSRAPAGVSVEYYPPLSSELEVPAGSVNPAA